MSQLLKYQGWHFTALLSMILFLYWLDTSETLELRGSLWGISSRTWYWIAIVIPVLHQTYVLIAWRLEWYHKYFSRFFGKMAFTIFSIIFFILFACRFVTITLLGISNKQAFELSDYIVYGISAVFIILSISTLYSVVRFFGMKRAAGLDHFDESVARKPFVKQGVFKLTNNAMYVFAFLIFYLPGLLFESDSALVVALFCHAYIWVHYFTTELPDIRTIYADNKSSKLESS